MAAIQLHIGRESHRYVPLRLLPELPSTLRIAGGRANLARAHKKPHLPKRGKRPPCPRSALH